MARNQSGNDYRVQVSERAAEWAPIAQSITSNALLLRNCQKTFVILRILQKYTEVLWKT